MFPYVLSILWPKASQWLQLSNGSPRTTAEPFSFLHHPHSRLMYTFHTNDCIIQSRRSAEPNVQTRGRHHPLAAECMTGMQVELFGCAIPPLRSTELTFSSGLWELRLCCGDTPCFPPQMLLTRWHNYEHSRLDRRRWLINGERTSAIPPVFRLIWGDSEQSARRRVNVCEALRMCVF